MQQQKSIMNTHYLWHKETIMDAQRRLPNEQRGKDAFCIYDINSLPEEGVLLIDKVSGNLSICEPSFMKKSATSQKISLPELSSVPDVHHSVNTCAETISSDSSFLTQIIREMLNEETTDRNKDANGQKMESMSDNLSFHLKSQTCKVIPKETSQRSAVETEGDDCTQRGSVYEASNYKPYFEHNLSICEPSFMKKSATSQKTSLPELSSVPDVHHSVNTCAETMSSDSSFLAQIIREMLNEETTDRNEDANGQKTESMSDNLSFHLKSQTCKVIPKETSQRSAVETEGDDCTQRGRVYKASNYKPYFVPQLRRTQITKSRVQIEFESLNPPSFQNKQFQQSITGSFMAYPVEQENVQGRRVSRTSLKGTLSRYSNPFCTSQRIQETLSEEALKNTEVHGEKVQMSSGKVVPPLNSPFGTQTSSSETKKFPECSPFGPESNGFLPKMKNSCPHAKNKNVSNCEPPTKIIKRQPKSQKKPGEGWPQIISVQEDALSQGSRKFEQLLASFSSPGPTQKEDLQKNTNAKKRIAKEIEIIDVEDFPETGDTATNNSMEIPRTENVVSEVISSCKSQAPQCYQMKGFDKQIAILCEPNTELDVGSIPLQKFAGQNVLIIIPNDVTPIINDTNNIVPVQLKNDARIIASSENVGITKISENSYQISNVEKTNKVSFRPNVSQDKSVKAVSIINIRNASGKLSKVHSINSQPVKKLSYHSLIKKRKDNKVFSQSNNVVHIRLQKPAENGCGISGIIKKTINVAPTMNKDTNVIGIKIQDIRNAPDQPLYYNNVPNVNSHPIKRGKNSNVISASKENSVAVIRHGRDSMIQNQSIDKEFSVHTSFSERILIYSSKVENKGNKPLTTFQNAPVMRVCSESDKSALVKDDNDGTKRTIGGLVSTSNVEECSNGKPDTDSVNEFVIPHVRTSDNQMNSEGATYNSAPAIEDASSRGPSTTEAVVQKGDAKSTLSDDIYPYEFQICSQCSNKFLTLSDLTENLHQREVDELPKMCKKCCLEMSHADYLNSHLSGIMNKPNWQSLWSRDI